MLAQRLLEGFVYRWDAILDRYCFPKATQSSAPAWVSVPPIAQDSLMLTCPGFVPPAGISIDTLSFVLTFVSIFMEECGSACGDAVVVIRAHIFLAVLSNFLVKPINPRPVAKSPCRAANTAVAVGELVLQ